MGLSLPKGAAQEIQLFLMPFPVEFLNLGKARGQQSHAGIEQGGFNFLSLSRFCSPKKCGYGAEGIEHACADINIGASSRPPGISVFIGIVGHDPRCRMSNNVKPFSISIGTDLSEGGAGDED